MSECERERVGAFLGEFVRECVGRGEVWARERRGVGEREE